jgi:hypothetical protein
MQKEIPIFEASGVHYNDGTTPRYDVEVKGSIYQAISNKVPPAPGGLPCNPWTLGSPTTTLW